MSDPADAEAAWRNLAQKALKGRPLSDLSSRTEDGITIEALQPAHHGTRPGGRGAVPWQAVQRIDQKDADDANRIALASLNRGASALALVFAGAATAHSGGLPHDGLRAVLRAVLGEVRIDACGLRFEGGGNAANLAREIADLLRGDRIDPALATISFGFDPVTAQSDGAAELIATLLRERHAGPFITADGRVVHNAGAGAVTELTVSLAGAVDALRLLLDHGLADEQAVAAIEFSLAADQDQFGTIAKFRAIRLLWARVLAAAHLPAARLHVHAETSFRMLTLRDPHANLVRATIAAFSAAVGGADSIAVLPFAPGQSEDALQLALNTQSILADEANIHRVADPGAGSGAIETLTLNLAHRAWAEFQAIEAEGGIVAALQSGMIADRIAIERDRRHQALVAGETAIVGTTIFRATRSEAETFATPTTDPSPFPPVRTAAAFEEGK